MLRIIFPCFLIFSWFFIATAFSLTPAQVLVVANSRHPDSIRLAEYYMAKRGIPSSRLIQLSLDNKELCSREDYEQDVLLPIREYLKKNGLESCIRCLVTMYGLPLKVAGPRKETPDKRRLEGLREQKRALEKQLNVVRESDPDRKKNLEEQLRPLRKKITGLALKENRGAAFDSELALVLEKDYSLSGWVLNPLFLGFRGERKAEMPNSALMVSRLDAPSPSLVRRMIDDSLAVEKAGGLQGKAYFDARYAPPEQNQAEKKAKANLYKIYDHAIYKAADLIRKTGVMPVVINKKPELFQSGECPNAALYSGWYSLSRYADAFEWRPGAVGYHIASGECATLKKKGSQVWCKRMIEEGVAATLGPVDEPYLSAFPPPDLFFGLLVKGHWTLAECYALSQPFWSWKMALIGDPLYRPFPRKHSTGP